MVLQFGRILLTQPDLFTEHTTRHPIVGAPGRGKDARVEPCPDKDQQDETECPPAQPDATPDG